MKIPADTVIRAKAILFDINGFLVNFTGAIEHV
jgi:hypothetical protein